MSSMPAKNAASLKKPWSTATSKHFPLEAKSRFMRAFMLSIRTPLLNQLLHTSHHDRSPRASPCGPYLRLAQRSPRPIDMAARTVPKGAIDHQGQLLGSAQLHRNRLRRGTWDER